MSQPNRDDDRVFMEIVDDFADIMRGADKTVWRFVHYRHELLWIHGICSMLMAWALAGTGRDALRSPYFILVRLIPGAPGSLAALLGLGGAIICIGLIFESFPVKRIGLAMLALFYLVIAASLAFPIFLWLTGRFPMKPVLYSPILYLHMALIMLVHIGLTFRRVKMGSPDDSRRRTPDSRRS
jgi:hypothetical protein